MVLCSPLNFAYKPFKLTRPMKSRHYLLLVLTLLFSAIIYYAFSDYSEKIYQGTGLDSIGHFIGFFMLTWLLNGLLKVPLFNTTICLTFYAALSEIGQYYLGFRNGEFRDVVADVVGILLFIFFKWCYLVIGNKSYR